MTQAVRQKWLLLLGGANAALALVVMAVVAFAASGTRRAEQEAATIRDAQWSGLRAELSSVRGELEGLRGLRAAIEELRSVESERPAPQDAQLTHSLQLIAAEQQLILMRSLQPAPAPKKSRPAARRVRRPPRTTCPVR